MTFELFMAARLPSLLRYAVVLTGDRELAQEIVQDVLGRAQARWRRVVRSNDPETYVRRAILGEYLSWRRRRAARRIRGDAAGSLGDRLAALGRRQRAVLVLRYWEDLDDDHIADWMGWPVAKVRDQASKALRTLGFEPRVSAHRN
ncbi:RNA polymerase [Paractinoplanes deccanensis]|uniref:RNA polymerase n=1 Tax=Paractinoplanes deccanensis TaxID=113561 RepID=A0ABQ3Y380_9ACTN|nr:sigma factor-like helix-turn-helix DNA-binding protein [Actinoplanes deccanensis]GID74407.1 RNA polymerase [Actinoplanes deccanensis]